MKIINMKAENVKKLVAVEITPAGNVVQITGKNGNGKSSILDAIWYALGGTKEIPGKPIRDGQEKACIELDLGDLIVKRRFTKKASTLTVENKEGLQYKSPQSVLDDVVGRLAFDPMAFMRLKPVEQFRELAEHAGIDFDTIDQKIKTVYQDRTDVNRQLKQAEAELKAIDVPDDAPDEIEPSSDVLQAITDAQNHNKKFDELCEEQKRSLSAIELEIKMIDELEGKLAYHKDRLTATENMLAEANQALEGIEEIDISPLQEKLESLEDRNNAARAKQMHTAKADQVKRLQKESYGKTKAIGKLHRDRLCMIRDADLPVEGVSFGDDVVTYNGIPLDQASSAEQLRVSVAVAMAMNPKLRVLRISDGSLLDSDSMKIIEEMAKDHDYQFWVERVDESGKVGIVIEDGQIKKVNS